MVSVLSTWVRAQRHAARAALRVALRLLPEAQAAPRADQR